ncbi:MAG TPA: PAS domain-containing sensor histidine kinase [Streptosporangiaceae bacterium]|jgi:PAS domain S-box-containing protein|nr:PAS domain-containing sensor histidine kinase [Streptosporangiaceae bacterium]
MGAAPTGTGTTGGVRRDSGPETAESADTRADAPFGALARAAPVGIVQSDANGRAVFVNERWCALTGLPAGRAVGTSWLDLLRPGDRARIEREMSAQSRREMGRSELAFDARLRTAAGAEIRVQGSVAALRRAGRPAGTLATFTEVPAGPPGAGGAKSPPADPTSQFVATVSHELRTPLTSIISFLELIRAEDDALSPDGVRFLDIIQRNANRLLRLVGDLLLLSRIESGISPPEMIPVSLPDLVRDAVRNAAPAAAGYGVTLKADAGGGPDLLGDPLGLTQVLDNLIANAVKFSHPGDTVRVGATWAGGQWRVDVADQGIGIPPDEVDELFQRFVRASNARTSGQPGTGLGLSVVKAIVEQHGGRVTVDSVLDQGTTFSIHLPAPVGRRA